MGIVIQELGNAGTSALDAAVDGIAASTHLDKKAIDHGLKLFGNFERSTLELASAEEKQTPSVFQNVAEYAKPAQILKEFVSSPLTKQQYMVPYKDVVKNMEDPQFKVSDGLESFTQKNIAKTLGSLSSAENKELSNFERKDVSNAGNKQLSNFERKDLSNFERKDLSNAQNKEVSNAERREVGNFEQKQLSNFERGVIYANNKPGANSDLEEKGIIVIGSKTGASSGLEEKGIIIVNGAPADINDVIRLKQIQSTDHKSAAGGALEEKGIIIVNTQPGGTTDSIHQISQKDRIAILQDSLIKLQKLAQVALQQLDLFEKMNSSSPRLY